MTQAPAVQLTSREIISGSPEQTFNFGFQIGECLNGGEILLLSGPLGAGKTVLIKGICAALGIEEEDVTSPSFTLVNPYDGRLRMYHIDLFRLDEGVAAAHAVDLDELLADETSVIAIEWAERMTNYPLPSNAWQIVLSGDGDDPRAIKMAPVRQ
jgi:tRNA threonylcarbamoyladenosine biosynthesis protein TsaE